MAKLDSSMTIDKYADNLKNMLRILNAKGDVVKMGGGA